MSSTFRTTRSQPRSLLQCGLVPCSRIVVGGMQLDGFQFTVRSSVAIILPHSSTSAFIAGAPPCNGTWVVGTLASALKKYSTAMCEPLPAPAVPKLIGLLCIAWRNSPILLAWVVGGAQSDSGLEAAIATVVKSS